LSNGLPGITERAARAIELLVQEYTAYETEEVCMPVVGWLDDLSVTGFIPGPCLALHFAEKMPPELIVEEHGLRVGFVIPKAILAGYESSLLDFVDDRFLFIPKSVAKFL
jgi:hypothetical protein